ncbi:MAG TPA: thiamine phosphate synthase, partial [Candidatus Cloacimonadota bacterium]|nr:thiamine phosphate synthase [Candidatus Cloacimonadota bacterium]
HLGPEDLPWQEARKIMSEGRIIGVSTHSLQEAQRLISEVAEAPEGYRPDYMSFGPIFPTVAKVKPDPPVGIELLQSLISLAPIPLVAIGGIFPHNQSQILSTGAKNLGMIRHFGEANSAKELIARIQLFNQDLKEL